MSLNQQSNHLGELVKKRIQSGDSVSVGRISQKKGVHRVEIDGETVYAVYNRVTKEATEYTENPFFVAGDVVTFDHKERILEGVIVGFVSAGRSAYESAKRQRLQGDLYHLKQLQIRGQLSYIISSEFKGEVKLYLPKVSTIRKV